MGTSVLTAANPLSRDFWAHQPPGVYLAVAVVGLLLLLIITGQQLLWLPLCAGLASLVLCWAWPFWVLSSLTLHARCLTPLRQGEAALWHVELRSRLPLWGLSLFGPLGLRWDGFIPGRSATLNLRARPLVAGAHEGSWHCSVYYPFNLWNASRRLPAPALTILPGLEPINYLPVPEPEPGTVRRALVCFDSQDEFNLGEGINHTQVVQLKLLANLCRALVAKGYEVCLACGQGLLTIPAYSGSFGPLDEALVQAQNTPARAQDLLARYNARPDAHLLILPQLLQQALLPESFPGQILWQLLFDEARFNHPLSRGKHQHKRLNAHHWQWVIEPQQALARLFYAG
ncbi:MAG: hypothetical protein RL497_1327 [Pseudomonadota bacterium]